MNFFDWFNKAFEDNEPETTITVKSEPASTPQKVATVVETTSKAPIVTVEEQPQPKSKALELALTLSIALMLESMDSKWPGRDAAMVAYEGYQELKRQGQGESEYARRLLLKAGDYPQRIEAARKAHELLYFMKNTWRQFGKSTLIMRPEHFEQVLAKYHLVCGNLSDYIGDIPVLNQREMEDAKVTFKGFVKGKSNPIYVQLKVPKNLPWGGSIRIFSGYPNILDGGWFIAAPREAFVEQPTPNIDPFVFTVSELGYILIHSMWGAEAEDATIKRYEQLRDAIIGKGGVI